MKKTFKSENIGYYIKDTVLNTMEYGNLPQNRERIYIIGFLSKNECNAFQFPKKIKLNKTIHEFLNKERVDAKYYYDDKPLYEKLKDAVINKDTGIEGFDLPPLEENYNILSHLLQAMRMEQKSINNYRA